MATRWSPTRSIVWNEGCDLHYWHAGSGPMIIFVPGGNGHGRQFDNIMKALCDRFTCVTFDRRQMSRSQVAVNRQLSPPQQARDIRTIITAIGHQKAVIFGSSSGGIFALQFAHDFPDMVMCVISHEAGLASLLPDASSIFDWFLHLLEVRESEGWEKAQEEFSTKLIGYDDEGVPKTVPPEPSNPQNFWEYEVPSLLGYAPNLWRIKENKTPIGVMRAVRCKDAFYARSVDEQAKILGCPFAVVAGHHQGFESETKEFLPDFLEMLNTLTGGVFHTMTA